MKGGLVCLGSLETSALPSPFDRAASLADNGSGAERQRPAAGGTHRAGSGRREAGGAAAQRAFARGAAARFGAAPVLPSRVRASHTGGGSRPTPPRPSPRSKRSLGPEGFPCPWAPLRKEPPQPAVRARGVGRRTTWRKGAFRRHEALNETQRPTPSRSPAGKRGAGELRLFRINRFPSHPTHLPPSQKKKKKIEKYIKTKRRSGRSPKSCEQKVPRADFAGITGPNSGTSGPRRRGGCVLGLPAPTPPPLPRGNGCSAAPSRLGGSPCRWRGTHPTPPPSPPGSPAGTAAPPLGAVPGAPGGGGEGAEGGEPGAGPGNSIAGFFFFLV